MWQFDRIQWIFLCGAWLVCIQVPHFWPLYMKNSPMLGTFAVEKWQRLMGWRCKSPAVGAPKLLVWNYDPRGRETALGRPQTVGNTGTPLWSLWKCWRKKLWRTRPGLSRTGKEERRFDLQRHIVSYHVSYLNNIESGDSPMFLATQCSLICFFRLWCAQILPVHWAYETRSLKEGL